MPICNPDDLKAQLPAKGRILALDHGDRWIGVAVSDAGRIGATPTSVVRKGRRFHETVAALDAVARPLSPVAVVVGLPIDMSGSEGPRAQSARQFADNLAGAWPLPIVLWDERMTTLAAERALLEADMSRRRREANIDKVAAAYLLQGFLDWLARA